jgi:hypothetical protein
MTGFAASRRFGVLCLVWLGLFVFVSVPQAAAQITTGSVSGVVKDAQGGVIPGATVVLISEARGTRSAPVVTNETGPTSRQTPTAWK